MDLVDEKSRLHVISDVGAKKASDTIRAEGANVKPLTRNAIEATLPRTTIDGTALVQRSEIRLDRTGKQFVVITLRCMDGTTCEARWWRFPYTPEQRPQEGLVYSVTGTLDVFNGERQLSISDVRPILDADLTPYIRATRRSCDELKAELATCINGLDPDLAALVSSVLSGDVFDRYCVWPAAQRHHGSLRHGLLAHSLRVADLVNRLCEAYSLDELSCDRPMAVAAALLHDVGKIYTLSSIPGAVLPERATRYDHVTLGILLVQSAAARLDPPLATERLDGLLHILLAHHGRRDWGAPIEPQTVEAWLVHLADLAEARLWPYTSDAATGHSPANVGTPHETSTEYIARQDSVAYAGLIDDR